MQRSVCSIQKGPKQPVTSKESFLSSHNWILNPPVNIVFSSYKTRMCLNRKMRNCFFLYNVHIKLTTKKRWTLFPQSHGPLVHLWDLLQEARDGWGTTEAVLPCGAWLHDFNLRHSSLPFLTWRNKELGVRLRWACWSAKAPPSVPVTESVSSSRLQMAALRDTWTLHL